MIPADRFIANKALDHSGWLNARRNGVTATEVAKAATKSGMAEVLDRLVNPQEDFDNAFMAFGRDMEGPLSLWVKDQFDVMPNEWLIAHENPAFMATPDGLSIGHLTISEIKTTGKDFSKGIPIQYRRQVQWQMFVTGATRCHFVWMLRVEDKNGDFQPGWIEPKHEVIVPDYEMQADLEKSARSLLIEKRRITDG
jgi:putative phage-type endonuclease